eukprot:SAG25_NODE_2773_length_1391_cov_1.316563_1_plen_116_part_10
MPRAAAMAAKGAVVRYCHDDRGGDSGGGGGGGGEGGHSGGGVGDHDPAAAAHTVRACVCALLADVATWLHACMCAPPQIPRSSSLAHRRSMRRRRQVTRSCGGRRSNNRSQVTATS